MLLLVQSPFLLQKTSDGKAQSRVLISLITKLHIAIPIILQVVSFANEVGAYTGGTFSSTGSLSSAINRRNNGSFNPSSVDPGTYTVTYLIPASGGCGEVSVTTEVTILQEVAITQQPEATRLCDGTDAHFEVTATGDGLTYQWYKDAATSGNEISGATSATLDISNISATDAGDYFVVVSGASPVLRSLRKLPVLL